LDTTSTLSAPIVYSAAATLFSAELIGPEGVTSNTIATADDLAFEVGLWLSGLESFLGSRPRLAGPANRGGQPSDDRTSEFRISRTALLNAARLNLQLARELSTGGSAESITRDETDQLFHQLRDAIVLSTGMMRAEPILAHEFKAWGTTLREGLLSSPVARQFMEFAAEAGRHRLPSGVDGFLSRDRSANGELHTVAGRAARILAFLGVVGRMLRNDEALKPSLVIFARVADEVDALVSEVDYRLANFTDEHSELFASLDAASYTAAAELRKVYQQELAGLMPIRPTPTIFARIESAYALLMETFQHIMAGFAKLADPDIDVSDLFPNFRIKLDQSVQLQTQLSDLLAVVAAAEQTPEKRRIETVNKALSEFLDETIRYLYYKDRETFERFGEEILASHSNKDLVPILHRFGAYLETLLRQVNLRTVLGEEARR
jgi:hypothetical protein